MAHSAQGNPHKGILQQEQCKTFPKGLGFHSQEIKKSQIQVALVSRNWWQNTPCVNNKEGKKKKGGKIAFCFFAIMKRKEHFFCQFSPCILLQLAHTFGTRNSRFITRFKFTITLQKSTFSPYTAPVVVKVLYKSLWVLTTPLWGRWVSLSPFSVGKLRQRGKKSDLPKAVQGAELVFWWPQLCSPLLRGNTDELPCWKPNNPTPISQALCPLSLIFWGPAGAAQGLQS